jgi:ribosomal protein S18 acetylase RimI-like enzyme
MIIRAFSPEDIQDCAALHKASRRMSEQGVIYDSDLDRYDLDHFVQNWRDWSDNNETNILIAEKDDKIVGFSMFGRTRTRPDFDKGVVPRFGAEIYALFVHPDFFRQGIGKALFYESCQQLSEQKLNGMILWAFKKNKRANAFYTSLGGEKIGKQKVELGEKSWAEESCFAWRDIRKILH